MSQISIFDYCPEMKQLMPGQWVEHHGRELAFDEAWQREGQLLVLDKSTQSHEWHQIIRVEKCVICPDEQRRIIAYDGHQSRVLIDERFFRSGGYTGERPTRLFEP